jgi:hypothetical protein
MMAEKRGPAKAGLSFPFSAIIGEMGEEEKNSEF